MVVTTLGIYTSGLTLVKEGVVMRDNSLKVGLQFNY